MQISNDLAMTLERRGIEIADLLEAIEREVRRHAEQDPSWRQAMTLRIVTEQLEQVLEAIAEAD